MKKKKGPPKFGVSHSTSQSIDMYVDEIKTVVFAMVPSCWLACCMGFINICTWDYLKDYVFRFVLDYFFGS